LPVDDFVLLNTWDGNGALFTHDDPAEALGTCSHAMTSCWELMVVNSVKCSFEGLFCPVMHAHTLYTLPQVAFLGLTTVERANLTHRQRKLPQASSLRQNPFK